MKKKTILIVAGAVVGLAIIAAALYFFVFKKDEAKNITITFNSNGGTAVSNVVLKKGEALTLPETTQEGFEFEGWFISNTKVNDNIVFDEDATLTARWVSNTAKEFTVTFDSKGGSKVASITLKEGQTLTLPKAPTKSGYVFITWEDSNSTPIYDNALLEAKDITLYATWKAEEKKE